VIDASSKKRPRSYTGNPSTTGRDVLLEPFDNSMHQLSETPTPPARRYNVGKRGADVTPVSTYQRDPVSHSEQELPVARKATRYSSDTEEFKSISASPEVEDPVVEPEYMDTEGMKYVPASPVVEGREATAPWSDTKERRSISTSPKAEERDATHVAGDAEDHAPDTKERRSISSSPEAEDRNATHASGVAGDQDSGTKALPDGVYEIEGLRGKQWSAGKLWLKIKWKNLPSPSWELAEHMREELGDNDYEELLQTMPRKRPKKAPKW
jgi:hypothetical protein